MTDDAPSTTATTARSVADPLGHRGLIAGLSLALLTVSWLVARHDPVPAWELDVTRWINDAPDTVASLLYPIMQVGSLLGPALLALGIVAFTGNSRLTVATLLAGTTSWLGAKLIKEIVERDRPLSYISDIDVRSTDGSGFGYLSGHSAIAATTAVMAVAAVPKRFRWVPVVVAVLVGLSRIVYGVHLPADVIGGWAFGTLVGIAALTTFRVGDADPSN